MSELLELTAAQAVEAIHRGEVEPEAVWSAYRERAAADENNAFTWVANAEPPAVERDAPLAGVPVAVKDLFATEGDPEPGRLEDPRALPPAVLGHRGRAAHRRGRAACWARPTRTSSRWAPRRSTPPTGRR